MTLDFYFKIFTDEYSDWLERNYRDYKMNYRAYKNINMVEAKTECSPEYSLGNRLKVNFKTMSILFPETGKLIRDSEPGLKAQYRTSRNMSSIKCSVYNLQVIFDNFSIKLEILNILYFRLIINYQMHSFQFRFIRHQRKKNFVQLIKIYHLWNLVYL